MSPGKKGLEERSSSGSLVSSQHLRVTIDEHTVLLQVLLGRTNQLDSSKLVAIFWSVRPRGIMTRGVSNEPASLETRDDGANQSTLCFRLTCLLLYRAGQLAAYLDAIRLNGNEAADS
jgi:hypothetical protein